jgi:hypothetical protein
MSPATASHSTDQGTRPPGRRPQRSILGGDRALSQQHCPQSPSPFPNSPGASHGRQRNLRVRLLSGGQTSLMTADHSFLLPVRHAVDCADTLPDGGIPQILQRTMQFRRPQRTFEQEPDNPHGPVSDAKLMCHLALSHHRRRSLTGGRHFKLGEQRTSDTKPQTVLPCNRLALQYGYSVRTDTSYAVPLERAPIETPGRHHGRPNPGGGLASSPILSHCPCVPLSRSTAPSRRGPADA